MPDEKSMIEDLREIESELREKGEYRKANIIDLFIRYSTHCKIDRFKIKEKIEELKNEDLEIYDTDSEDLIIAKYEQRAILDFLEELLQEGEKNGTK